MLYISDRRPPSNLDFEINVFETISFGGCGEEEKLVNAIKNSMQCTHNSITMYLHKSHHYMFQDPVTKRLATTMETLERIR